MKWDVSVLRMPSRNVYPLGAPAPQNFTQTQPEKKTHTRTQVSSVSLSYFVYAEEAEESEFTLTVELNLKLYAKEENRSGHINIWCVCWLDVRAPQWWEPSSVFIGEPERSEEWERQVLSLLPTITFLRQLFPAKCVRDEKALYWTSIFCTGKFGWHIEGMDVNVFMNTILLWNKSWWTVSLKYLQCRGGEWEILSEQVLLRENEKYIERVFH